jgi:hypothetical protein
MSVEKEFVYPYRAPPGFRNREEIKEPPLYPLLNIQLYTDPSRPRHLEGLLDSGADTIFIPTSVSKDLNLPRGADMQSGGVFGTGRCYRTQVGFIIGRTNADKIDFGMVPAVVPTEQSDIPILIGRDPLFKYFEVIFKEYKKERPTIKIIQKNELQPL